MTINTLFAGDEGDANNSTGADVATAVNSLIALVESGDLSSGAGGQGATDIAANLELITEGLTQIDLLEIGFEADRESIQSFKITVPNLQDNINKTDFELLALASDKHNFDKNNVERLARNDRAMGTLVHISDDNATITNLAFAYTDNTFSQASTLIDGVNARVDIEASKLTVLDDKVTSANASISVQAGQIAQRATYSEISTEIGAALAALTPVYSWQFNSDAESFTGSTHNATGFIAITASSPAVSPTVSYDAEEFPTFRMLVRQRTGGAWDGVITTNRGTIPVPAPSAINVWEVITVKATLTGTITALSFDLGDADIDYIEVAKQGANDIALADLVARVTTAESEINAIDGTYITGLITTWYNNGNVINSDVSLQIDSFNTQFAISATLQSLSDQDTVAKANSAQTWVDGATANIRNAVVAYNNENGISSQNQVTQDLDAIRGSITNQSISIRNTQTANNDFGLAQLDQEFQMHLIRNNLSTGDAVIALANNQLRAYVDDENTAIAESITTLLAIGSGASQAEILSASRALSSAITGNSLAINSVTARTTDAEDNISDAFLALESQSSSIRGIKATATFGVDVNGNFTGVTASGSIVSSKIRFSAGEYELYDNIANELALSFVSDIGWTFGGHLSAVSGTFGALTTEPTGSIRTALPNYAGTRVVINGPDTMAGGVLNPYALWVGEGPQNASNADFFLLKAGGGFIKGSLLQGQLLRERAAINNNGKIATATGHLSAGKPVEVAASFLYSASSSATTKRPPINLSWQFRRGTQVIDSGTFPAQLFHFQEEDVNQFTSSYTLNLNLSTFDAGAIDGQTYDYTFEITSTLPTGMNVGSLRTTVKTYENLIG